MNSETTWHIRGEEQDQLFGGIRCDVTNGLQGPQVEGTGGAGQFSSGCPQVLGGFQFALRGDHGRPAFTFGLA